VVPIQPFFFLRNHCTLPHSHIRSFHGSSPLYADQIRSLSKDLAAPRSRVTPQSKCTIAWRRRSQSPLPCGVILFRELQELPLLIPIGWQPMGEDFLTEKSNAGGSRMISSTMSGARLTRLRKNLRRIRTCVVPNRSLSEFLSTIGTVKIELILNDKCFNLLTDLLTKEKRCFGFCDINAHEPRRTVVLGGTASPRLLHPNKESFTCSSTSDEWRKF